MPLNNLLLVESFDVQGIEFKEPFPKWIETIINFTCDAKVVMKFLKKNNCTRFGIPRIIISDKGIHFYNKAFNSLLTKYKVNIKRLHPTILKKWISRYLEQRNEENYGKYNEYIQKGLGNSAI